MTPRTTTTHRIIAVLIAAWIPFCCCTLKVAGELLLQDEVAAGLSCCGLVKVGCESDDSEPAEDSEQACLGCCVKNLPDAPGKWNPPVDHGEPMTEQVMVSASVLVGFEVFQRPPTPHPPDPPSGHTLLERGCLLLV